MERQLTPFALTHPESYPAHRPMDYQRFLKYTPPLLFRTLTRKDECNRRSEL